MKGTSEDRELVSVSTLYSSKSILVTGGTGFLGKVLIEKILWSCPEVKNIFMLVRPTEQHSITNRLTKMLKLSVFDRLRNTRPSDLEKIVLVNGDLSKPQMGISQTDRDVLTQTISIIFHVGASVRFNDTLRESVAVNLVGTKRLIEFARQLSHVDAIVHVSTAYCNADHDIVNEEIYDLRYEPEKIMHLLDIMDDDIIAEIVPKLIGNRPNVYTYTKALAENVLKEECTKLPLAIIRPSIVVGSMKEPLEGWIDSWNGPTAFVAAGVKGLIRRVVADHSKVADLIPVDMVANLAICAAWRTATQTKSSMIDVYNCCSGEQNPITWGQFIQNCLVHARKYPVEDVMIYPFVTLHRYWIVYRIGTFFLEELPVHLLDMANWIRCKESNYVPVYKKLMKARESIDYFATNQWHFKDDNVKYLINLLSEEDKQTFTFDVGDIRWPNYLESYVLGIRHFLFKNSPDSLPQLQKLMKIRLWQFRYSPIIILILIIIAFSMSILL